MAGAIVHATREGKTVCAYGICVYGCVCDCVWVCVWGREEKGAPACTSTSMGFQHPPSQHKHTRTRTHTYTHTPHTHTHTHTHTHSLSIYNNPTLFQAFTAAELPLQKEIFQVELQVPPPTPQHVQHAHRTSASAAHKAQHTASRQGGRGGEVWVAVRSSSRACVLVARKEGLEW